MVTFALSSLPIDILQCICDALSSLEDVKAFSLVSSQFTSTARRRLFRGLLVNIHGRLQLEYLTEFLRGLPCLGYVQRLHIHGSMPSADVDLVTPEYAKKLALQRPVGGISNWSYVKKADDRKPQNTLNEDSAWMPLADLIRKLPALQDVFYNCENQLSPCLLTALHQHRPQCKLHILYFFFRSVRDTSCDSHEFAIASSPCLHHINIQIHKDQRNKQALFRTISTLAPNLREVTASISTRGSNLLRQATFDPWPGFSLDEEKSTTRIGHLTTIDFKIYDKINYVEVLKIWATITDFSVLRVLTLHGNMRYDALVWLAKERPFKSLRVLNVTCKCFAGDDMQEYLNAIFSFITGLPPLEILKFVAVSHPAYDSLHFEAEETMNMLNKIFVEMVQPHSKSLRRLRLASYIRDQSCADQIRRSCPLLEEFLLEDLYTGFYR